VVVKLYYNSVEVWTDTTSGSDEELSSLTIDLSPASPTKGTVYEAKVTVARTGIGGNSDIHIHVLSVYERCDESAPGAPNLWNEGDTDVDAANMNNYRTIIRSCHPAYGSPTVPLYYEQPAQWDSEAMSEVVVPHTKRFLYTLYDGAGTPQAFYGNLVYYPSPAGDNEFNVSQEATYAVYDTESETSLVFGDWMILDDCLFAQESDNP
jgi:hypothetical protein